MKESHKKVIKAVIQRTEKEEFLYPLISFDSAGIGAQDSLIVGDFSIVLMITILDKHHILIDFQRHRFAGERFPLFNFYGK